MRQLDKFLDLTDRDILQDLGKVQHKTAKIKAESEFEKFRLLQDKLFESDFDKEIKKLIKQTEK